MQIWGNFVESLFSVIFTGFWAKKLGVFFLKTKQCYDSSFLLLAVILSKKRQLFLQFFLQKKFKHP
jgi:hypothetical protein